jgi:non-ribosomal peptide synthase protein (TIGR01720 family)
VERRGRLLVDLEGHGREELGEEVDVSRTVGWFTTMYPVRLEIKAGSSSGAALKGIKEQLRGIPQRGIGYGLLRYVRGAKEEREQLREAARRQVSFNYLGQFDQLFTERGAWGVARESSGIAHDPSGLRAHLIDVSGIIGGGSLQLTWVYSEAVHRRENIEGLAQDIWRRWQELIAQLSVGRGRRLHPVGFPLAKLEHRNLIGPVARAEQTGLEDLLNPLSPMQRGMLFHSLYAPESGVYCTQLSCVLEGDLKLEAFEQAWQQVVDTHPILRTAFVWEGRDKPLQVVQRGVRLPIEWKDWLGESESEQQEQLRALLAADQQRGFQLTKAPLMRLTLVRLSEQRHELIWNHHHLLLDGWCLPLLLKDVFHAIRGICAGE